MNIRGRSVKINYVTMCVLIYFYLNKKINEKFQIIFMFLLLFWFSINGYNLNSNCFDFIAFMDVFRMVDSARY